jgi:glycosyltransferase involved in cell wall biosynthesis
LAEKYGLSKCFPVTWLNFTPGLKQYDFALKSYCAAMQWGAQLIYTWTLQVASIASLCKKPVVMEMHDYPMGHLGPTLFRVFFRAPGKKLILTTTHALARGLQEKFKIKIPDHSLQVAPNGTDLERYADLPSPKIARQELHLKDKFTVVYTGHFYRGRGIELLLGIARALPHLQFLWIGGRDEDVAPWKKKLSQEKIDNVVITGFIENARLPLYQATADLLVMPYEREISASGGGDIAKVINPMKMFDYLACGRPIIASDIPIFHEILNEKNAYFCPPENVKAWVSGIQWLVDHPQKRKMLAHQASQDAQRYSWKSRSQTTLIKLDTLLNS